MSDGRIVVGFDGSDCSWHAVDYAASQALAGGMTVRLVHALLNAEEYVGLPAARPSTDAAPQAQRLLDFAKQYLYDRYPGLPVQVVLTDRPAISALVAEARTAAMVVVGRRGRRGVVARLMARHFGSVSEQVAAHAAGPVVVVGQSVLGITGPVVLGVDAVNPVPAAITFAFEAAMRGDAELQAEYVWTSQGEWPTGRTVLSGSDYRTDQAMARRKLSEALADWRAAYPDVAVAMDVVQGVDPAARLLDMATGASLLVVGWGYRAARHELGHQQPPGPRGRTRARFLASSVGDLLVRNAPCPVAVVHGAASREPVPHAVAG